MNKDIKEKLKKIKTYNGQVNPDRSWVSDNRERLISQINNTTLPEKHFSFNYIWDMANVILPNRFAYSVVRPVAVFLLVGVVATSGWIASVGATANSLPGDLGYGIKKATEKTQEIVTAVTSSDDEEAKLHLEFASRRAKEVKQVVEKKNTDKDAANKAKVALSALEKSVDSANEKIQKASEKDSEKIVETTKAVKEKTKEIKKVLKDVEKDSNELGIDTSMVKKKVSDTGLAAVEAVVQKQEEGLVEMNDEDVRELVKDQIEEMLEDVGDVKKNAEVVVKDLEEAENNLKKEEKLANELSDEKKNNTSTGVSTTEDVVENMSTTSELSGTGEDVLVITSSTLVSESEIISTSTATMEMAEFRNVVEGVVKKVSEADEYAQKDLEEAKVLTENNLLREAIEKVKQVTTATEETEQAVREVKKAVEEIAQNNENSTLEEKDSENGDIAEENTEEGAGEDDEENNTSTNITSTTAIINESGENILQ